MAKSNTPTVFQNEKTKIGKSKAQKTLEQKKLNIENILEPTANFENSKMTKVRVTEFPSGTTLIIDETEGNIRTYEIHSSGTYDAKLPNGDLIQKSVNNHIIIVKKDMKIAINGDSIEIVKGKKTIKVDNDLIFLANKDDGNSLEEIVTEQKLKKYLESVTDSFGTPIFQVSTPVINLAELGTDKIHVGSKS